MMKLDEKCYLSLLNLVEFIRAHTHILSLQINAHHRNPSVVYLKLFHKLKIFKDC